MARVFLDLRTRLYYADFSVEGVRRRVSLRTRDRTTAEDILETLLVRLGRAPAAAGPKGRGLAQAIELYLREATLAKRPSTVAFDRGCLRRLLGQLGDRSCDAITREDLLAYFEARSAKLAPRSLRRERQCLSPFFRWCALTGLIDESPVVAIKLPRPPRTKINYLSYSDLVRLLVVARDHRRCPWLAPVVGLCGMAGLRRGEPLALYVEDLAADFRFAEIRVRGAFQPKDGEERTVPLLARLRPYLAEYLARVPWKSGPLFRGQRGKPLDGDNAYHVLQRLLGREGISKVDFNDLRHTCATLSRQGGLGEDEVDALLGHAPRTVSAAHYVAQEPEHLLRRLEESWANYRPPPGSMPTAIRPAQLLDGVA